MALFLEIIDGPEKGKKFRVQEGFRVGRKLGEILLNDEKLSAMHAQVEKNPKGELLLVDAGSEFGLEINSRRVKRVLLKIGIIFGMGSSSIKVIEEKVQPAAGATAALRSPLEQMATPFDDLPELEPWKITLLEFFKKNSNIRNQPNSHVKAFQPIFSLLFIKGIQSDTEWTLGWGPREVGRDSIEFRLKELVAPGTAFHITPNEWGQPEFFTEHPRIVLMNGEALTKKILVYGDRITIADTEIEVISPRGD